MSIEGRIRTLENRRQANRPLQLFRVVARQETPDGWQYTTPSGAVLTEAEVETMDRAVILTGGIDLSSL